MNINFNNISCEAFRPSNESIEKKRQEIFSEVKADPFKFFEANVIVDARLKEWIDQQTRDAMNFQLN